MDKFIYELSGNAFGLHQHAVDVIRAATDDLSEELGFCRVDVDADVDKATGDVIEGTVVVGAELVTEALVESEDSDDGDNEGGRDDEQGEAAADPLAFGPAAVRWVDLTPTAAPAATTRHAQTDTRGEDAEDEAQ